MNKILIQILTKNNEATIEQAIKSVQNIGKIQVLDFSSEDETKTIVANLGVNLIHVSGDRSKVRNDNFKKSQYEWMLALEPWEILTEGEDLIINQTPGDYQVFVINDDTITKETRLIHKSQQGQFVYPVFETYQTNKTKKLSCMIKTLPHKEINNTKQIQEWKQREPLSNQPLYYEAIDYLKQEKYDDFIVAAQTYLFNCNKMNMTVGMLRYYLAMIFCYIKKDPKQALENLMIPLPLKPLMSEFWCLLGDIHYFLLQKYDKAKVFYHNAKIMGTRRKISDDWPIQLSKYKDYPNKMIDSCNKIEEQKKLILL